MAVKWAVVPGDAAAAGAKARPLAHRPDPQRDASAYCGALIREATRITGRLPGGIRQCGPCRHAVAERRRALRAEQEKTLAQRRRREAQSAVARLTNPLPGVLSPAEAEAADRAGRQRERGTSVRAMGAGLPTLGRGH